MITQAVWDMLTTVIGFLIQLGPDTPAPAWFDGGRNGDNSLGGLFYVIGTILASVNSWLPVTEMAATIPILVNLTMAIFTYKMAVKVYALVRGGGD